MTRAPKITEKTEDHYDATQVEEDSLKGKKPEKRRAWSNIYGAGYDFHEKLSSEFKRAIDIWEPVVETRQGQIEFINACKKLETDALNYLFYRANGRLVKAFKRSSTFTGKAKQRDEIKEDFHDFLALVFERTLSDTKGLNFDKLSNYVKDENGDEPVDTRGKGPLTTFNLARVPEETEPINAFIGWCGLYFDTYADQMRVKSKAGGISRFGTNDVVVSQSHVAGKDDGEETEIERVRKVDGTYADVDSSRYQGLDRERPVEESLMDDALIGWKKFCKEPLLRKMVVDTSDQSYSFADLFKDFLLGENVMSKDYCSFLKLSASNIHSKLAACRELLQNRFSDERTGLTKEDLYKLLREYKVPNLVKYLPASSFVPTLSQAS